MNMMKMNSMVLLAFCFTSLLPLLSLPSSETHFENRVYQIIEALREQNTQSMLNLIHKDSGLIIIHRPGVFNFYHKFHIQELQSSMPDVLPDFSELEYTPLKYETQPTYSCGSYQWNKTGLFSDTTSIDRLLSDTAKDRVRFDLGAVSEAEIRSYLTLENNSRKIMLTDDEQKSLLFSLSLIDKEWYLSVLDLVTDDCDS